jgi:hypothetical protein
MLVIHYEKCSIKYVSVLLRKQIAKKKKPQYIYIYIEREREREITLTS